MFDKESIKQMIVSIIEAVDEKPIDTKNVLSTDTADRDSMFQLFSRIILLMDHSSQLVLLL